MIDGMSDDGTRRVLDAYALRYPFIRVLENVKRITPVAFNIGVRHARGGLIMIMSAHATFHPDAIAKAVTQYMAAWNEPEATTRYALLEQCWWVWWWKGLLMCS